MNKSTALELAKGQLENHRLQVSGVWSVSEEVAKEIAEALGVNFDEATQYVDDMAYEEYHEALGQDCAKLRNIMGDVAYTLFEESDAAEAFEENFREGNVPVSGTHNEYFWSFLLDNAEES